MAENITRTIYSSFLQTCKLLNLPYQMQVNTTLNELFGIQNGVAPSSTEIPSMRYWAIGNGGHRLSTGSDGISIPQPIQHLATDAALYNHLPFVLRETTNDLSVSARANYALRKQEVHNGITYIAYYLKRMTLDTVTPHMQYVTVSNGVSNVTVFIPNSANLNPVPPALSSTGVNVVTGDYVKATAVLGMTLSASDIAELLNVSTIIYSKPDYAIISEIALCSGLDKLIQVTGTGNATFNFMEAIAVQVVSHINTFFPLVYSGNSVEILLDVGSVEPLYLLT